MRRTTPIDVEDMGDLDAVALRLEDLVGTGDAAGVEQMWLRPEQLRGCQLGAAELPNERLETFVEDRRARFREQSAKTFGRGWSGNLVFTDTWSGPREILNNPLRGSDCPADGFGRVKIYVRRSKAPRLLEHRFHLERVDGEWKVFFYNGRRARCDEAEWQDGPACSRLADSRPK